MDYSKMSDKEINKHVAFALGCKEVVPDIFMDDNRRYEFDKPKNKSGNRFYFDPCNNPVDAWPIIHDNRIGVIPAHCPGEWKAAHRAVGDDGTPHHFTQHANPLRAAMIAFLMMQDARNEK